METPASTRMITRSQSAAMLKKSRMQEDVEAKRQPLFDITNDSPITSITTKGIPTKHNTSSIKSGGIDKKTLLSGESLLLCQALVFDKPDKSELTAIRSIDSSSAAIMDNPEAPDTVSSSDDDCSSVWSLQVNASSEKEDLDEENEEETKESEELDLYYDHEKEDEEEEFFHDLCKGMNGMCIGEETESGKCVNFLTTVKMR